MTAVNLSSRIPFVNLDDGTLTPEAYRSLSEILNRTGGVLGNSGGDITGDKFGQADAQAMSEMTQQPESAQQLDEMVMQPSSDIVNTPAGNIAATTVQAAINELDAEKAGLALTNTFTATQTLAGAALNEAGTVILASAATTDIGAAASNNVDISGTVTITGFGTCAEGINRKGRFTGALILAHNATSLILPGNANITTAANDRYEARSLGAGNWIVTKYEKATGLATVAGGSLTRIKATRDTVQSIPNAAETILIYATEVFDTLAEYDPATGRATIGQAGYYAIHGQALSVSVAWDAAEIWMASIFVNGAAVVRGLRTIASATATLNMASEVNALLLLAAGDIVDIRIYHTQGAAVDVFAGDIYNNFTITRLP